MNFLFIPNVKQIPEWKQCYFDNKTILILLQFITECNRLSQRIILQHQKTEAQDQKKFYARSSDRISEIIGIHRSNFHSYFKHEQQLVANFVQYKIFQISNKFKVYQTLIVAIKHRSNKMLLLLQNLFIESFYLQSANIYHKGYETAIIDKLKIQMGNIYFDQHQYLKYSRLSRMNHQTFKLRQKVQSVYNVYSHKLDHKLSFEKIRKQFNRNKKKHTSYLYIGAFMGGLMSFVAILIVMSVVSNITLDTSQKFADNFPAWRGGFQFVFYIWVLGLNALFYQKSNINYKLVFQVGKCNFPSSTFLFSMASSLTFILLFLMLIMFLQINGIIQTDFTHYVSLFWFGFLIYLFLPFKIFNYRGRLHWIKMIGKTLFFCFFKMNFLTIWIAQQMISLTQPTSDFFYGIFNLFADNRAIATAASANFHSAITIGIYVERFFQNLKNWLAVCTATQIPNYDFWLGPFLGTVRAFFGFYAVVAALLNRLKLFEGTFPLWVVTITVASIMAWFADVKGDWGLFQHQTGQFFVLRKKLLYPNLRFLYIFILFFDLFLRVAWVLSIAPFFVYGTPSQNLLFVMMLAFLEMFRRGVWNILRIQNEFIKNCGQFQATVRDDHILSEIKKQINMKIKKNIQSMSKNMQSHTKINKEDDGLGPSSKTILQSQELGGSSKLIESIQSLTYFKKLAIKLQEKPEEQKRAQLRIRYQKQLFRNSLKQRQELKKVILEQSHELQKELKNISQKVILGNVQKKFIIQQYI